MKHGALLTALLTAAVVAMAPAPASAQDLAGMWELSQETGRGTRTSTLSLTVDGMTLTGTVTTTRGRRGGGGGGGPQAVAISDGKIDGSSFSFTLTRTFGDNTITQTYSGTIDGATLTGTIEGRRPRWRRTATAVHGETSLISRVPGRSNSAPSGRRLGLRVEVLSTTG